MGVNVKVDLLVIGAGSGGTRAARIASSYGAKVTIVEASRIGGTCVIRGCVPKKLYVYSSRFRDALDDSAGFGWEIGSAAFDWRALVEAKEKETSRLSSLYRAGLEQSGVEIVEAHATIEGPRSVRTSDGRSFDAEHILVATGGWPALSQPIPGIKYAITSNDIFDLEEFPKRLLIVGGGYIAVEFASVFVRFGAHVTQVIRSNRILRGFDSDIRDQLTSSMAGSGINLKNNSSIAGIEKSASGLSVSLSDGDNVEVDAVLMATGRVPLTKDLGLDNAGVVTDQFGAIVVGADADTNVKSIFAVGDVTNRINLTPIAIREGHAFADRIFGGKNTFVDYDHIPTAVFTTPEIGTVGLSEEQARLRFRIVDIYVSSFKPMKSALSGRSERTFLKIVVDGETDRVVGAHGVGQEMAEMAQLLAVILKMGATKADLDATMALHPTVAEEFVTMRTRTARHEQMQSATAS